MTIKKTQRNKTYSSRAFSNKNNITYDNIPIKRWCNFVIAF